MSNNSDEVLQPTSSPTSVIVTLKSAFEPRYNQDYCVQNTSGFQQDPKINYDASIHNEYPDEHVSMIAVSMEEDLSELGNFNKYAQLYYQIINYIIYFNSV